MEQYSKLINSVDELIISLGLSDNFNSSKEALCSAFNLTSEFSATNNDEISELIDITLKKQLVSGFVTALTTVAEHTLLSYKNSDNSSEKTAYHNIVKYINKTIDMIEE